MRPYYVLLLALAFVIACTNTVFAEATNSVAAFSTEQNNHRALRATATTEDQEEEERGLIDAFKNWRLKRSIKKVTKASAKAQKAAAKEAAALEKLDAKMGPKMTKWLEADVAPSKVYKNLRLNKFKTDEQAVKSPMWKYYEDYLQQFQAKWGGGAARADDAAAPAAANAANAAARADDAVAPAANAAAPAVAAAAARR